MFFFESRIGRFLVSYDKLNICVRSTNVDLLIDHCNCSQISQIKMGEVTSLSLNQPNCLFVLTLILLSRE